MGQLNCTLEYHWAAVLGIEAHQLISGLALARSDRDTTNAEVYGEYTYMNGGIGPAFQWAGPPAG